MATPRKKKDGWNKGPLPPDTYDWGGVVLKDQGGQGFFFADFCGDHVKLCPDGRRIEPDEIDQWTNCLKLPPGVSARA